MKKEKKYIPNTWQKDYRNVVERRIQLWHKGVMVTAQLSRDDARQMVAAGTAFVITDQAIGTIAYNDNIGYSTA